MYGLFGKIQGSGEVPLPYQTLIYSFLTDSTKRKIKPSIVWDPTA